ncbi:hypothetical protein OU995_07650 [Roseateles sp. SL47]|uniref:HrpJ domain-containing protein n=1 Tax=Roseateles sp. SL47 TaxID=2995138 RepID=UPI00226E8C4D|nr:HrpJ domain-containing protein [Roseateles sp. SL47]WAC74570.1 hypothetical protein OU995_07650 [Roseateles sp. SL47]
MSALMPFSSPEALRPLEGLRPPVSARATEMLDGPMAGPGAASLAAGAAVATAGASGEVNLNDAAEELTFGAASRMALRGLGTPDRTHLANFGRDPRTLRQVYRIARLKSLHAAYQDTPWGAQAPAMAQELLAKAKEGGNVQHLADLQSVDPFKRYAYLLEADELAQRDPQADPAVRERLQQAQVSFWQQHQRRIMAGFNTARPLARFAQRGQEWDDFREIYYDWVLQGGGLAATFKSLLSRFGPDRMRDAVDTLRQAIVADLASPLVQADWSRLVQQQGDLERTRTIWSLVVDADRFLAAAHRREPTDAQVMGFVSDVLDYATLAANERRFSALCATAYPGGEVSPWQRSELTKFLRRHLPMEIWSSPEARETLFTVTPPSLSAAIAVR